ncbi:hypothetical protein BO71DRAFT_435807 [Aspergillus ellipticus CBS 707.79]|uniref:Uncharacterized protein n=1 Tax=Aspergillus ellipticus CBS 707.79 TaxID=1448320 RepID=A0A319CVA3_9EURO|nr:hypothetical protein BO71DRAFT_435807 [Aspergillus ellipticus CBS 707.79]
MITTLRRARELLRSSGSATAPLRYFPTGKSAQFLTCHASPDASTGDEPHGAMPKGSHRPDESTGRTRCVLPSESIRLIWYLLCIATELSGERPGCLYLPNIIHRGPFGRALDAETADMTFILGWMSIVLCGGQYRGMYSVNFHSKFDTIAILGTRTTATVAVTDNVQPHYHGTTEPPASLSATRDWSFISENRSRHGREQLDSPIWRTTVYPFSMTRQYPNFSKASLAGLSPLRR